MPSSRLPGHLLLSLPFLAMGCSDVAIQESSACDGALQAQESSVDSPFDRDGDGYFDGSNQDCIDTYGAENLDCDDANEGIHPNQEEEECNGVDDDCREDTPDSVDSDADGSNTCEDCDDTEPAVAPGNAEICGDGLDNHCDGFSEEGCVSGYSDTWGLDTLIAYSCAFGNVNISFASMLVSEDAPEISFTSLGTGSQPGTMVGILSGTDFTATRVITGTCTETYTFTGTFNDLYTFDAEFSVAFSGILWWTA